jgi:2-C-methyl-D-erythritol 4-phosphate cytidylyltransferase
MTIAAIVPAAGSGERLGASIPKALVQVASHSLICRAVETVAEHAQFIVVTAPRGYEKPISVAVEKWSEKTTVITGGSTRKESVALALAILPDDVTYVLVHDAARCFTPGAVFLEVVHALKMGNDAVVPLLGMVDTIKRIDANNVIVRTEDRETLGQVQTPQGFALKVLKEAHERHSSIEATDDAMMVEAMGLPVLTVMGHDLSRKITTPSDIEWAEALVARRAK